MHRNVIIDEKLITISFVNYIHRKSTDHMELQYCGPSVRLMRYFLARHEKRRDHVYIAGA